MPRCCAMAARTTEVASGRRTREELMLLDVSAAVAKLLNYEGALPGKQVLHYVGVGRDPLTPPVGCTQGGAQASPSQGAKTPPVIVTVAASPVRRAPNENVALRVAPSNSVMSSVPTSATS